MITSSKNPRVVKARKLRQRKHRYRQNRFLVEGLQILGMAAQAMASPVFGRQVIPVELFYNESLFTGQTAPQLLAQLIEAGAEPIPVAPRILDLLSEREISQGLAATFALDALEATITDLIREPTSTPRLILVLDRLQDPGNLGTLIRTADSVSVEAVILLEPCADPFDPKTVRSTMGSIFTVPFVRTKNGVGCLTRLSELGYYPVGADAGRGCMVWQSTVLSQSVALVLGNEAQGLSPELDQQLAAYVSLPLQGQAESLNVAVAGGVLMYEWMRVNR